MNCVATGSVIFTPDSGGASITPDQWVQIHAGIHTVSTPRWHTAGSSHRVRSCRPARGLHSKPASQPCINTPSSSIGSRACVLARP